VVPKLRWSVEIDKQSSILTRQTFKPLYQISSESDEKIWDIVVKVHWQDTYFFFFAYELILVLISYNLSTCPSNVKHLWNLLVQHKDSAHRISRIIRQNNDRKSHNLERKKIKSVTNMFSKSRNTSCNYLKVIHHDFLTRKRIAHRAIIILHLWFLQLDWN